MVSYVLVQIPNLKDIVLTTMCYNICHCPRVNKLVSRYNTIISPGRSAVTCYKVRSILQ